MLNLHSKEKELLLKAVKIHQKIQVETADIIDDRNQDLEYELSKQHIFISRRQINDLVYYLELLPEDERASHHQEINDLEKKLIHLFKLP